MATRPAKKLAPRKASGSAKKQKRTPAQIQTELDRAKRLRDSHDDRVDELQRELLAVTCPKEPDTSVDPPPVIRFKMRFPGSYTVYNYAALGHRGLWYLSQHGRSNRSHSALSWDRLMQFIPKDLWDTVQELG